MNIKIKIILILIAAAVILYMWPKSPSLEKSSALLNESEIVQSKGQPSEIKQIPTH